MIVDENTKMYIGDTPIIGVYQGDNIIYKDKDNKIDEHTLLLLHCNNSMEDVSPYHRTGNPSNPSYNPGKFRQGFITNGGYITFDNQLWDLCFHDFTIDFWLYVTDFGGTCYAGNAKPLMGAYKPGTWPTNWLVAVGKYNDANNTRKLQFRFGDDDKDIRLFSNTDLVLNTWQHLAVTYNSLTGELALWYNGTKDASVIASAPTYFSTEKVFSIGKWFDTHGIPIAGIIDEIRISDCVRYTKDFTPNDGPYRYPGDPAEDDDTESSGDEYTVLLLHANDFTDSSQTNLQITNSGWSINSNGEFNNCFYTGQSTGNRLFASNNAALRFGTGDFTIDWWMKLDTSWANQPYSCGIIGQKQGDWANGWVFYKDGSGNNAQYINARIGMQNNFTSLVTPSTGIWEHWAFVRHNGTIMWFHNGHKTNTGTNNTNVNDTDGTFYMGYSETWSGYLVNTYIDEMRISNVARWTDDFIPPVRPY